MSLLKSYQFFRWTALVLFLSSAAYLFAWLTPPAGLTFLGFLANNDDAAPYLSFMREGARGDWLTTFRFTPEPHRPALVLPLYLLLGKVARLVGLSDVGMFHIARLLCGIVLLAVVCWFLTCCLPSGTMRQSAFLLVCFSAGLGWLLIVVGLADTVIMPIDIRIPESSTFLIIFTSPHFVLGVAFELLTFIFFLGGGRQRWHLLLAAVSLLLLSLTLVYNVIVVAVTLSISALVYCLVQRKIWMPVIWQTILVGLVAVPVVLYYYILFRFDPFWSIVYGKQDVVHSPNLLALVLGYGLVFGLAVWGLIAWFRQHSWTMPKILLTTWTITNGLLLYMPLSFQGKLAAGWHIALCAMAAVGLHEGLLPWLQRQSWFARLASRSPRLPQTARNVIVILTIPTTLLISLIGFRVAAVEHYFPYFLPVGDVNAVAWLGPQVTGSDVVLSSYGIGNYLVAHTDARAFLGHQFAVIDPLAKSQIVQRFFEGQLDAQERQTLFGDYGITWIFYGTMEKDMGDLDQLTELILAYQKDGVSIYRVHEVNEQ